MAQDYCLQLLIWMVISFGRVHMLWYPMKKSNPAPLNAQQLITVQL
jgi:hypothetical protein